MELKEKFAAWIQQEKKALDNIPLDGSLERAVEMMHDRIHLNGGKIVVAGVGKAGNIGMKIASTFASTGSPAVFLPPLDAQHGELGLLQKQDVLILISNSGQTEEVLQLKDLVAALYPEIPAILITGNPSCELAEVCDITISTGSTQEICPLGLTPTTSTTVMTVIGDLLVVAMMDKITFNREDYGKRHHSGYLGNKARHT